MFEIKKTKDNSEFYFVIKARNGKVICTSQMYTCKFGAQKGIRSIRKNAEADVKDLTIKED
jgi:uncharacterized protein YegP (UPF0339 family)